MTIHKFGHLLAAIANVVATGGIAAYISVEDMTPAVMRWITLTGLACYVLGKAIQQVTPEEADSGEVPPSKPVVQIPTAQVPEPVQPTPSTPPTPRPPSTP